MIDQTSLKSIEDLHRMKAEGIITEAEFEASKQRILFGSHPAASSAVAGSTSVGLPRQDDVLGWLKLPLQRYADFKGRSGMREFWLFQLIPVAILVVMSFALAADRDFVGERSATSAAVIVFTFVALLALFIPQVALQARRFHDQNRSGLFVLLNLIPYAGFIIVMVMMLLPGTNGDNRYGPDPRLP